MSDIRNPKFLSVGDICRPVDSGKMLVQDCEVESPLPCIVILVHGVNDVGEAYQNQDEGICQGLNERLGRDDLHPHDWKAHEFMISDPDGNISATPCPQEKQTCIGVVNRSPTLPFYWGYKPVDKATWEADQKRYRDELREKRDKADLAYDTYQQDDKKVLHAHNDENVDNLNNWLDPAFAKGGGTFANATTNIPDMFGPGANGAALEIVGALSRSMMNDGDWSHPIYANPHRIYQAFAARRLADLILAIRQNESTKKDTINIVAHSQGTIVTMLANLWVKAEGLNPADCVILNNSPYSLENRWLESAQPGNQQTDKARQQTLAHFCKVMADNPLYNNGQPHNAGDTEKLYDQLCLSRSGRDKWHAETYNRNNFGLVYNYFCPNDQVVSMLPVQGMGWRGIPDKISAQMGENLRQRVFCKDITVGDKTGYSFVMPEAKPDDPEIPKQDVKYTYQDVTINGAVLPEPFVFALQGQKEGYEMSLTGNDPAIAKAARKAEDFPQEVLEVPDTAAFRYLRDGQPLGTAQLAELSTLHQMEAVSGRVEGEYGPSQRVRVRRYMTKAELEKVAGHKTTYSQHSSIVCNPDVPVKVVPYDLAIGRNEAFEDKAFWDSLLLRADWRRGDLNPLPQVREYYSSGKLPEDFKKMMNKPETGDKPMPTGESGVINDYGPRTRKEQTGMRDINGQMETREIAVIQWDMPKPQV